MGGLGVTEIGAGVQRMKGSPVKPGRQLQIGLWLMTRHWAWTPHVPRQGSTQRFLTQARSGGH